MDAVWSLSLTENATKMQRPGRRRVSHCGRLLFVSANVHVHTPAPSLLICPLCDHYVDFRPYKAPLMKFARPVSSDGPQTQLSILRSGSSDADVRTPQHGGVVQHGSEQTEQEAKVSFEQSFVNMACFYHFPLSQRKVLGPYKSTSLVSRYHQPSYQLQ
jgi:hypothetical protein